MNRFKRTVQAVIFHNESNLYSVLKVKVIETSENLEEKQHLSQATSQHFMRMKPTPSMARSQVIRSLASSFKPLIFKRKSLQQSKASFIISLVTCLKDWKKTAEEIVGKLGNQTLHQIMRDPSVLYDVPRLSKRRPISWLPHFKSIKGLSKS